MSNYKATTGSYKGNKIISLENDEKKILSFGYKKAKAILELHDEIKKFVEDCENNGSKGPELVQIDPTKLSDQEKADLVKFIKR